MGCTSSATAAPAEPATKRTGCPIAEEPGIKDFHEKYRLGKKIGMGGFAQVHDVFETNIEKPAFTAVKIIDLRADGKEKREHKRRLAKKEARIWKAVGDHVNCVRMLEAFFDPVLCYMVMDKCPYSLVKYIGTMEVINERELAKLCAQMLSGIAHVHKSNVVHCDVKHDNFLVAGSDGHTVKLADFGLSVQLPSSGELAGISGTAPFLCPEMLETKRFDTKADVWSLGVVMHTLLYGDFPYRPREKTPWSMKEAIKNGGNVLCKQKYLSDNACNFLRALLNRDRHQRLSALDARGMPYISSVTNCRDEDGAPESDMPDLRVIFSRLKHSGAYNVIKAYEHTFVDVYLNLRQSQCHGKLKSQPSIAPENSLSSTIAPDDAADECNKVSEDSSSVFSTNCGSSDSSSSRPFYASI